MRLCEATAMDAVRFGNWTNPVPPCDEDALVEVDGYSLCPGCARQLGQGGLNPQTVLKVAAGEIRVVDDGAATGSCLGAGVLLGLLALSQVLFLLWGMTS